MVLEKVKHIISQQFDVAEEDLDLDTNFVEDLGADSISLLDLVMGLEDEFETEVEDDEIEDLKTIEDAVKYIESRIGETI